jgi:hypothetical protein
MGAGLGIRSNFPAFGEKGEWVSPQIAPHQGFAITRGPAENFLSQCAHFLLARVQNAPTAGGVDERRIEVTRLDPVEQFQWIAL